MLTDTTTEARAVELEIFRRMSPEQRLMIGFQLSEQVRAFSLAGLRARHPGKSETMLLREYIKIAHDIELPADEKPE
jgi:hypothetical protein